VRVPDSNLRELEDRGFTIVPGFLSSEELADAQESLWKIYPHPNDYFSDPKAYAQFEASPFAGLRLFPYCDWSLNKLAVLPDLINVAERFLKSEDLEIYKAQLWAKYYGATNYDQPHHRDFGNHTLVVPSLDGRHRQMTCFILLSDVTEADGPTKLVPLSRTRDLPLIPTRLAMGELFDEEVAATGPAGSLMVYRTDVFHRGSDISGECHSRFAILVDFQERGWRWQGKMSWPNEALNPGMSEAIKRMTVRQRDLFGWPPPGSDFWTKQTLRDVSARYPGLDMSAYDVSNGSES
jgi:hypothetical protein